MKNKYLICLSGTSVILGCATPYQSSGLTGGYKETKLAPDIARITVEGNGYTSRDRVQDFALLRASEMALQSGYPYFTGRIQNASEYLEEELVRLVGCMV
jgi:hypothetical protein